MVAELNFKVKTNIYENKKQLHIRGFMNLMF